MVHPTALAFQATSLFTTTRHPFLLRKHFVRRSATSQYSSLPISIFDNVLSPACRNELTTAPLYNIGPDTYRRSQGAYSPQDVLIESILTNLGGRFDNSTREVEWWGRELYESVEAHRDADEEAASVRGERRYPTHSVIVYLDVEDEEVRAPTCIWVPDEDRIKSDLLVVPVVPGRLLVFSGEMLHAVPCPPLQWLSPVQKRGRPGCIMRRVLVMNLWDDYAPKDEEEYENDDWHDAEEEDDDEEDAPIEFFAKRVECEPRERWKSMPLQLPLSIKNDETAHATLTLSTRSHGSDELLLSPLSTYSYDMVAQLFESESTPQWLRTGADVGDLGIGVPSLAGSRRERTQNDI
mmetsp:Transcript_9636/g.14113  ORF Transcript_9636/g.14113 Transcript_9636/m.14113 type:complete len:351 (+) Transcript_9636:68-1120(+)